MNVPLANFHSPKDREEFEKVYQENLKAWPLSFEERDVETSFGLTRVLVSGKKKNPPLVLLHGLLNTPLMWRYNIASLARHFCIYMPERLGDAGVSRVDQIPLLTDNWSQWLTELFAGLNLTKPRLAGFSLGGWHAAQFAFKYPQKIHSLALLSPVPLFKKVPYHVIRDSLSSTIKADRPSVRRLIGKQYSPQFYPDKLYENLQFAAISRFLPAVPVYPRELHGRDWSQLPRKTLIVVGEEEIYFDPLDAREQAKKQRPDIPFIFLEETGHSVSIERPNVVNHLLEDFFRPTPVETRTHHLGSIIKEKRAFIFLRKGRKQ